MGYHKVKVKRTLVRFSHPLAISHNRANNPIERKVVLKRRYRHILKSLTIFRMVIISTDAKWRFEFDIQVPLVLMIQTTDKKKLNP